MAACVKLAAFQGISERRCAHESLGFLRQPGAFMSSSLSASIVNQSAIVGVIGLGYVGLPLIQAFVESGFKAIGFDVDESKIQQLMSGRSYIGHIDDAWIGDCVGDGRFQPTADMERLAEVDVVLICVPTPLNESRDPDLRYVESTARQIGAHLRSGQLIVLESTTYPGTTRDIVLPILSSSGLKLGKDFFLAYSPEREDPGNPDYSASRIPKVIGGIDQESLQLAEALYSHAVVNTVRVSSCEIAEACKIVENTYRSVNIAMVNELKVLFARLDIDIWEVIDAAKTKPFGFQPFYPGPGLGGHCIPIDPFYLSWVARKHGMSTRFIELAGEVNASMPKYVVDQVIEGLNETGQAMNGSHIGILGVAYKRDIDDPRESPAFKIIELMSMKGAIVSYNDPYIPDLPDMRHYKVPRMTSQEVTSEYLCAQDCVLIVTDHSCYDYSFIVKHARLVVDTRNATGSVQEGREKIRRA